MKYLLRRCEKCETYTLSRECTECKQKTSYAHCAPFSLEDRYGEYRRKIKQEQGLI
ncbi:MAG: nucleolar RNA-binding Nop10p family protein [Candidatus Diapherotrites archaeon]|nr:nucleolar RNA-binding Nop10p family protein [Candidatus Diapherotrites archaeon]